MAQRILVSSSRFPCRSAFSTSLRVVGGLVCIAATVAGCGATVEVSDQFPSPLLAPVPLAAGLRLDDGFTEYVHEEKLPPASEWKIRIGRAQTVLFTQLFNAMFARLERLEAGAGGEDLDVIIEPQVEQYAFTSPRDNGSDFFEVSIRYRLSLYLPDGALADAWQVDAYGRSRSGILNAEEAVHDATVMALRDAAALVTMEIATRPKVQALLAQSGSP